MDLMLQPVRAATSKQAQKGYVNTALFLVTSIALFCLAAFAYMLFYFNFVPQIGIEKTVHFQFSEALQPWGIVHLGDSLIYEQTYDIKVHLELPRSPANLDAGNFMLEMALLSPAVRKNEFEQAVANAYPLQIAPREENVIFRSRRPAILTYSSYLIDVAKRFAGLPWYVTGWQREAEALSISMAERISFSRGRNGVPASVLLEMKHGGGKTNIQVYDAKIEIRATFGGLRWVMYHHRIFSFSFFTTAFWLTEMSFVLIVWVLLAVWPNSNPSVNEERVKREGTEASELDTDALDLSDTPRTFPTLSGRAPLRYEPKVKTETTKEDTILDEANIPPFGAEADDESEEPLSIGNGFRGDGGGADSGIGTSLSEGGGSSGIQRRRSKGKGRP